MSLKETLKTYIARKGIATFEEIEDICKKEGRRISNGERRLREIIGIESIKSKKGAIVAYKWVGV